MALDLQIISAPKITACFYPSPATSRVAQKQGTLLLTNYNNTDRQLLQ